MRNVMKRQVRTAPLWWKGTAISAVLIAAAASYGQSRTRVQDLTRLQGQRTNKLMGYGLVVGLNGTGDGGKVLPAMRALMSLQQRYGQPVLNVEELLTNSSVALVVVEAEIPEFGAREGQTIDATVSVVHAAKSLAGGQLLVTPLQYSMFDPQRPETQAILALSGGRISIPDPENPRRGIIRNGATLEADVFYHFLDGQFFTLVLDDTQAGFPLARLVADAVNREVANPATQRLYERDASGQLRVLQEKTAVAIGPKNVRVRIPSYEMQDPSNFISRVLEAELFELPTQAARVVINRQTMHVSFTGAVTVAPVVMHIPGLGTVNVGTAGAEGGRTPGGNPNVVGLSSDPEEAETVSFQQLLSLFGRLQVPPREVVRAVEHLHQTGAIRARLVYAE